MRKSQTGARELALNVLYQVDTTNAPVEEALQDALEQVQIDDAAKEYSQILVRGTLKEIEQIDERLSGLSPDWPLARQASVDRNILRLSVYEIDHVGTTPNAVVINEAVELAKKFSTADSGKFINGVLAAYLRKHVTTDGGLEVGGTNT